LGDSKAVRSEGETKNRLAVHRERHHKVTDGPMEAIRAELRGTVQTRDSGRGGEIRGKTAKSGLKKWGKK